jgi:hypothetical protein
MTPWLRPRLPFIALAAGTIVLGLLVHLQGQALFLPVTRDVVGDALYAVMTFWWIGAAAPHVSLRNRWLIALLFCVAIELSQLYHAQMIDAVRATLLGHLVLGSYFDWRDLGVYAGATLAAVLTEKHILQRARSMRGAAHTG